MQDKHRHGSLGHPIFGDAAKVDWHDYNFGRWLGYAERGSQRADAKLAQKLMNVSLQPDECTAIDAAIDSVAVMSGTDATHRSPITE